MMQQKGDANMIILTGDTHRQFERIKKFCMRFELTTNDLIIILGDAGINYYNVEKDIDSVRSGSRKICAYHSTVCN